MKKMILLPLLIGTLSLHAEIDPSCRGCGSGKLMLQCDYYVVKQGRMEMRSACEEYAKIVDVDGASAKAAWYYLLAGKPDKAQSAAKRAVDLGQVFANEYLAYALLVKGREDEAKAVMKKFRNGVEQRSFVKRDIEALAKLYPDVDFGKLK